MSLSNASLTSRALIFEERRATAEPGLVSLEMSPLHRRPNSKADREYAVLTRRATKSYGIRIKRVQVFANLDMTVPRGCIYGLLGASGCGKTTLLGCILGRKNLNSGQIWVLGGKPGSKASGVPGARVGYMPQNNCLYESFTIKETLTYYGWIAGLSDRQIDDRYLFLSELLMLPKTGNTVKNLSGGEQRRTSLACALLHEPELLVLDEPTVGVDPVVRQTVWDYLLKISREKAITVIITTHYIEEARQANLVALMRGGTFLVEEPPDDLINRFRSETLEDVFLKLSSIQNQQRKDAANTVGAPYILDVSMRCKPLPEMPPLIPEEQTILHFLPTFDKNRVKALLWKGFLWMPRNPIPMIFIILLPLVIIGIFSCTIGTNPVDLRVALVDREIDNFEKCDKQMRCDNPQLSCIYSQYLTARGLNLIRYDSASEAVQSVNRGQNYAYIHIPENYTKAMQVRFRHKEKAKEWDLKNSEIDVYRDVSNKNIALFLKMYLYDTFQTFVQDYVESCNKSKRSVKIPINFDTPIYGTTYPNFTDFAFPGTLLSLVFILAVSTSSISMLMERNEGSFERIFVVGITEEELLLTHVICEFSITLMQVVIAVTSSFGLYGLTLNGSVALVFCLCCLTGFCGMCYGLLLSCVCDRELTATLLATGTLVPILVTCGVIWPLEAMHYLIKPLIYMIPLSTGTESMRSILQRGWNLSYRQVYQGFLSTAMWSLILLFLSIIFLKLRK